MLLLSIGHYLLRCWLVHHVSICLLQHIIRVYRVYAGSRYYGQEHLSNMVLFGNVTSYHIYTHHQMVRQYLKRKQKKLHNSHTLSCVVHRVVLSSSNILEQMIRTWTVYPTSLHADPVPSLALSLLLHSDYIGSLRTSEANPR